ncbi:Auxin response factor 21 [Hordeum vulgare]|nr:Auxin response factor 21 [Hordeum vulgare]
MGHNHKPMDMASLVYATSTRKNWKVREALKDDAWVKKIQMSSSFSIEHFRQFLEPWATFRDFHVQEDIEDDIVWKHSASGLYTVESAYKA